MATPLNYQLRIVSPCGHKSKACCIPWELVCQAGIVFIIQEKDVDMQEECLTAGHKQGVHKRTMAERETKVFWTSLGDPGVDVLYATPTEIVHGIREISGDILHWESVANKELWSFLLFETTQVWAFSTQNIHAVCRGSPCVLLPGNWDFCFFTSFSLCLTHLYWKHSGEMWSCVLAL